MTHPLDTPRSTPSPCPFCSYWANTLRDEIRHMESVHPDVIDERLMRAGFVRIDDRWVDALADPNDKEDRSMSKRVIGSRGSPPA